MLKTVFCHFDWTFEQTNIFAQKYPHKYIFFYPTCADNFDCSGQLSSHLSIVHFNIQK